MRNVETWMVWAARWQAAGSPGSPAGPVAYQTVSEKDDYKKMRSVTGEALPNENKMDPYNLGKVLSKLNPVSSPVGTPPALRDVLQPLSVFLNWCQV
jgi:hypothetical protein